MSRKLILLVIAALVSCFCAHSASAQTRTGTNRAPLPQPTRTQQTGATQETAQQKDASQVPEETADLAITATVTAKELRFEVVPNPTVEFPGKPKRDTVWDAERQNLPRPVEPGVTYRDIGIRLKIVSRFADIERIVAEALGEVPVTDEVKPEAKPPDNTQPQPNTQPPATTPRPSGGTPR